MLLRHVQKVYSHLADLILVNIHVTIRTTRPARRRKGQAGLREARRGDDVKKNTSERPFAPSSFLLLVVRPGAPSSVLAPSSDARIP